MTTEHFLQIMDNMTTVQYGNIMLRVYLSLDKFCPHRMEQHVLMYLYEGEVLLTERGRTTVLSKGECAFIRKDCNVMMDKRCVGGKPFVATFLSFTREFLLDFYKHIDRDNLPTQARRKGSSVCKLPTDRPDIKSLFDSLLPYYDAQVKPTDELLKLKMIEGLYVLLNTDKNLYASLFDFADPWKIDILDFMNKNYMNDLSIRELAVYTGRSLATFKRDFGKVSVLTPERWLIKRRLEEAHQRLEEHEGSVTDICYQVGFKNLSHFSKAYKMMYGTSPARGVGG